MMAGAIVKHCVEAARSKQPLSHETFFDAHRAPRESASCNPNCPHAIVQGQPLFAKSYAAKANGDPEGQERYLGRGQREQHQSAKE